MPMMQEKKKEKAKTPDMVSRIQEFGRAEMEKKRKEEEEKKKNKGKVDTAPSKGILSRIYEFATGTSTESEAEKKKKK